jgi:hypothetical protein
MRGFAAARRWGWGIAGLIAVMVAAHDAAAGGGMGLSVRGRFSGSDAAIAGGAFGGAALLFGAAGEAERWGGWRGDSTFLIIDAAPPDAQVYLDGRRLGTAGELTARALSVSYGTHAVHVRAPGFRPWATRFVVDGSFPVRLRPVLARE